MNTFSINGRSIGLGQPAYIIAELSANHHQSYETAVKLLHAVKASGADAVKLQTYTPDTMTVNCRTSPFQIGKGTIWEGKNLYDLYGEAYTPWEWQPRLKEEADKLDLTLFSTPFDSTSVDFLEKMNVPAHKIASFELVDLPLIRKVGATGKPIIMSTGMGTLQEIAEAVDAIRETGNTQIALLKCTSAYPASPEDMNLRTIPHLSQAFGVPSGLSDHTMSLVAPVAAVTLGASIIEKHFTLSRATPGPDSAFSLEPHEFKAMVEAVRTAEKALGHVSYKVTAQEQASKVFRRSLFVVKDIKAGEIFTEENVRSIRPGYGLSPKHLTKVLGKTATTNLSKGTPLEWYLVQ